MFNSILNSFVCLPGSKSPETLREQLSSAMKQKDKIMLEKAINECVAAGFSELDSNIHQARDLLNILAGGRGGTILVLNLCFLCLQFRIDLYWPLFPVELFNDTSWTHDLSLRHYLPILFKFVRGWDLCD